MSAAQRLQQLRQRMTNADGGAIDAYLVPSADAHQSEYTPQCWSRRAFLSGFDGSAGDVIVTANEARLWTDGRYWLQATSQLDATCWTLMRGGDRAVPTPQEWLAALPSGSVVGVDARVLSVKAFDDLAVALRARGSTLRAMDRNLVDEVWTDRPAPPRSTVRPHPIEFAGKPASGKLAELRAVMESRGADGHVLSALDAIAWLFNLRASDVPYNPVLVAHAIVTRDDAAIYTDTSRLGDDVRRACEGVAKFHPYERFDDDLRAQASRRRWWLDDAATSAHVAAILGGAERIAERSRSPVTLAKARKNEAELRALREVHVRDGAAMVRLMRWMHEDAPKSGQTECSVADKINAFRAEDDRWVGPAFSSIVGEGANGAIIHYRPAPATDRPIRADSIVLIDSGGQYLDGTTDITRMVHLGKPTVDQRDRCTRVLKGLIAVTRLRFPKGTTGLQLDAFARHHLWSIGLDYAHGTGHGVGAALCVHEWPPSLSHRPAAAYAFEPGMVLSNEPGCYESGAYGLRLENLIEVVQDERYPNFLRFDTLTLCPIEASFIDPDMLTLEEEQWVNAYHARVRETLEPRLAGADAEFLRKATRPLREQVSM